MTPAQAIQIIAEAMQPERDGDMWKRCPGVDEVLCKGTTGHSSCMNGHVQTSDCVGGSFKLCPSCNGTGRVPALGPKMPAERLLELMRWCWKQEWYHQPELSSWGGLMWTDAGRRVWRAYESLDLDTLFITIAEAIQASCDSSPAGEGE